MKRALPATTARLQRPPAASGSPPNAPASIGSWRDDGEAIAVEVIVETSGLDAVFDVARQLPDPHETPAGTLVVVLPEPGSRGRIARLLGRLRRDGISASIRGSALVARGYVDIGGDDEVVWGFVPRNGTI